MPTSSPEKRVTDHEFVPHPKGPDHFRGCSFVIEDGDGVHYCSRRESAHAKPAPQDSPGETVLRTQDSAELVRQREAAFCGCGDACNRDGSLCPVCVDAKSDANRDLRQELAAARERALEVMRNIDTRLAAEAALPGDEG